MKEKLKKALIKRAVGYTAEEVVSEYSDDNGMMKMVRKKGRIVMGILVQQTIIQIIMTC